jgi:hypothetical protein
VIASIAMDAPRADRWAHPRLALALMAVVAHAALIYWLMPAYQVMLEDMQLDLAVPTKVVLHGAEALALVPLGIVVGLSALAGLLGWAVIRSRPDRAPWVRAACRVWICVVLLEAAAGVVALVQLLHPQATHCWGA